MAIKVYHRLLVDHSTFRKIAFRTRFYHNDIAYAYPLVKHSRRGALWNLGTDHTHDLTITPTTSEAIRIPKVWRTT